ncbi:MAG: deaminase [Bryobacterales bacterium]|nr:deaminase [Bryobacterales bacterium]
MREDHRPGVSEDQDATYLRQALELAAQGKGLTSPNPAVGALVVRDGRVIGRGCHTWSGVKHAEVLALEEAGDARGATVYLTLEPCSHTGRTAPCHEALPQGRHQPIGSADEKDAEIRW